MSTIDSGHLEGRYGGQEGSEEAVLADEEKVSICGQTRAPGVSVAQVARRYSMNTNLIHKWLRDPRFAPDGDTGSVATEDMPDFLPIEIEDAVLVPPHSDNLASTPAVTGPVSAQSVDITLSDQRRISARL